MKKQLLIGLLTLTMGIAAQAISFDYASTTKTGISFNGAGGFSFSPASGNFMVTDGSANGDLGEITGSSFTIGTITTFAGVSTASVTGTGTFVIHDSGGDLTATLVWNGITQVGQIGGLSGTANLTGISYGGSNADLAALLTAGVGDNVLTFQDIASVPLISLTTGTKLSSSFSGTVAAVPDGGSTVALLGCALIGLTTLSRTMKSKAARA